MENKFLAIDKRYFGTGLKSLDLLIVAHIEEFQRNDCECYLTNQQFCEMFGEDINAVRRSLKKLEDMGVITRNTTFISGNGRSNRQRKLTVNPQWKTHSESSIRMENSDDADGRLKSDEWKTHNDTIKDKKKIRKDNVAKDSIYPEEDEGASVAEADKSPERKDKSIWAEFIGSDGKPGRRIRDLCGEEVREIKERLKQGVRYLDIEKEFGMRRGTITAKFGDNYRAYCQALAAGRIHD